MSGYRHIIYVIVSILLLNASNLFAKVYWLPDYLGDNTNRSNGLEDNPQNGVVDKERGCPNGWLDAAQKGDMTCDLMGSYPWVGYCYSNCKCKLDKYPYTSDNCTGTMAPSGDECNDGTVHYKECIDACETVEGVTNCPYGCKTTFEAEGCPTECKECYTDNCHNRTSVEPCDYGCESYFSDCSSKCQKCYADNCRNRTDNATDLGCDSYWQDCASKCEVGKTCVPTDCSAYTLTSCPANATCTNCTVGCGNSTKKYKLSSCNNGYEKSGNTCQACDFGDYNLDSCPNAGSCSNITCGNVKKYKLNYCTTDFQIIDNTCVRCEWGSYIAETNLNALSFDSKSQCGTTHYKIYTCESGYKLVPSGKFCTAETTGAVKITYQMEANGELGVSRISSTEYVSIDWGDGNTSYQEGYATWIYHKYSTAGVYQITINGSISKIKISPTNGYVISFEQLDLSNWKDANSQVGSAYQTSFAGDCSYATGEIPNLPPNLTNGRFMFYRCTKLTGNIPILPDTLTDGYRMFIQAYNLSGYPPAMPASLTSYDAMFTQTKVTNDGSWPSGAW